LGGYSGSGTVTSQLGCQRVQQAAHALFAPSRRLVAVDEGALLGEDESGAGALGSELHRGHGNADTGLV
jgi:hypothetical protein